MVARILFIIAFWALYFLFELYLFQSGKIFFKKVPLWYKWGYWLIIIIPIGFMMLQRNLLMGGLHEYKWVANFFVGLVFTIFVTKLFFAVFWLLEDLSRIIQWSFGQITNSKQGWPSRRIFISQIGLGIAAIPFFSFLYGITRGKYAYTLHKIDIIDEDLPAAFDGFKIVQISDVHSGSFDSYQSVAEGLQLVQDQNADLILFTGDMVNSNAKEIELFIPLFEKLKAPYGKFSVLGNHDYGPHWRWEADVEDDDNMRALFEHQKKMGFTLLRNETVLIEKENERINLSGCENWGKGPFPKKGNLVKTFQEANKDAFTILMSHDPSHWTAQIINHPKKVHLTLSGHTHGMQAGIEIPGFKWSPVKWRYPQWAGLYEEKSQKLYVNRGFGFLGFPGRVGILPEVTLFELKRKTV